MPEYPSSIVNLGSILALYADLEAAKAEVEAMKVKNEERLAAGMEHAYNEQDFRNMADTMQSIGRTLSIM